MLVYGDRAREADAFAEIAALRGRIAGLDAPGLPIERHARLAALFIAAAELAQGVADAVMARAGGDGRSPDQDAATALLMRLAEALLASWRDLELGPVEQDGTAFCSDVHLLLDRLAEVAPPGPLRLKTGEGHAFYTLYPEAYAAAAAQLSAGRGAVVIGLRSIGLGLAATAAAALGAEPPLSLRPVGHPFRRTLRLTPALEAELRARSGARFVVVDEGPGLSGSSFGAAADGLERLGVPAERIAFLPGHAGELGPEASEAHCVRWRAAERPVVGMDALLLETGRPGQRLSGWFADLTGGESGRLQDLSGGAWRGRVHAGEADWPACDTFQERRKFWLEGGGGAWLLKFAGLGRAGERAFDAARRLGKAGWSPRAVAFRHGFLAYAWVEAEPLRLPPDRRAAFARHLGRYLGWRAAHLPAGEGDGASLDELRAMLEANAREALGNVAGARALDRGRWAAAPPLRRVWTDNRLHAREWLQDAGGCWLKADAVDHAAGHDLVGAQDIAWDVAGARVEFGLDARETAILLDAAAGSAPVEPALVTLLEPAYAAFQLGAFTMAAAVHAGWPAEQRRLAAAAASYRDRLAALLAH